MVFVRKTILSIVAISLLGSTALAYGLSTEFLFNFDVESGPFSVTSNSTHILVANSTSISIYNLSGIFQDKFEPTNSPRDVAINKTHIFVLTNANEVELFNLAGIADSSPLINSNLINPVRGMDINSTHVFIADTAPQIQIFDFSGNIADTIPTDANLIDPVNVAIDSNGRIIVLDNGGSTAIDIYDSSLNHITSFGDITSPNGIDVDSNNRIIVSDGATFGIFVFDSLGNQLTTFGGSGTDDGEFTSPTKLTVDSNDRIIVPDFAINNRIQVFSYVSESGGSSANKHKTAPTSGNDWNTHNPLVKDGVSVDGKSFDITDNWWTPFEQIQINTNSTHSFSAKTYAQNGGVMVQEFAFGIPSVGEYHNAESIIEVHYNYDKSIDKIVVIQDTEVIEGSTIFATTEQVSCDAGSTMCYLTTVHVKFNEPLKDAVYAIKAFDMSRRSMMPHYFNDGVNIVGENMNSLALKQIPGIEKGEGLITITQVEKYSDLWMAEDGRIFEMYGESESIRLANVETKRVTDTGHVNSRTHSAWDMLIEHQNEMAAKYFDSSKIQTPDKGFIAQPIDEDGIDHRTETLQKLNWR